MREFLVLLKKEIKLVFSIDKIKKNRPIKNILYLFLGIYILISLVFSSSLYSKIAFDYLTKFNLEIYLIIMFSILSVFSIFMFTLHSAKSKLFNSNDNDLLFSLPIKSKIILFSRFISIYLYNLIFSFVIMLPASIIYIINVNTSFLFIFYLIIIILLIPLIPCIIASLFGFVIAVLTSRFKSKNIFEIILSFVLVFSIYIFIYNIQKVLDVFIKNPTVIENILKYFLYNIYLMIDIISKTDFLSFLKYILINGVFLVVFIYFMDIYFKKIIFKLSEDVTKTDYKFKNLKKNTILLSLFKKDLKRYISSPIYVLNTGFGIVMILFLSISTIFIEKEKILSLMGFENINVSIFQLIFILILFISFLSNTTSSTISIEGKNFWILKSLPIEYKSMFLSKILLNLLIIIPIVFISIIIFGFTLNLSIIEVLLLLLFTTLFALVSSLFGLIINLKFPKMDAINDIQIVKQSLSVLITVIVPIFSIMFLSSIYMYYLTSINFNIILLIIFIIFVCFLIIELLILKRYGYKRIKEI